MGNDWDVALEQNSDLSATRGSADDVALAVRRGADLRFYMTTETYEETLYFQQTYVGDGDAFAGLMSHHHSYTHRGTIPDQPYVSLFKYDTSGTFSHVKWMLGDCRCSMIMSGRNCSMKMSVYERTDVDDQGTDEDPGDERSDRGQGDGGFGVWADGSERAPYVATASSVQEGGSSCDSSREQG